MNRPLAVLVLGLLLVGCVPANDKRPPSPSDPANPDAVGPAISATRPAFPTTSAAGYRCPMHPSVVRAAPERCPDCDMTLERDDKGGTHVGH